MEPVNVNCCCCAPAGKHDERDCEGFSHPLSHVIHRRCPASLRACDRNGSQPARVSIPLVPICYLAIFRTATFHVESGVSLTLLWILQSCHCLHVPIMQQFRVPSLRHSPVRSLLRTRFTSPPSIEILRERAIGHPHPITLSGTLTSECMGSSWPHAGGWSKSRADRCCELRLPARRVGCSSDDPSRNARSGNGSGSVGETPLAFGGENGENGFGGGSGKKPLPTQGDAVVEGPGESRTALKERDGEGEGLKSSDLDYLAVGACLPGPPTSRSTLPARLSCRDRLIRLRSV